MLLDRAFDVKIVFHPEKPGEPETEETISFKDLEKARGFVRRQRRKPSVKSAHIEGYAG